MHVFENQPPGRHAPVIAMPGSVGRRLAWTAFASAKDAARDLNSRKGKNCPSQYSMQPRHGGPGDGRRQNDPEPCGHEGGCRQLSGKMNIPPVPVVELPRPILAGPDLQEPGGENSHWRQSGPSHDHGARMPRQVESDIMPAGRIYR